MQRMGYLVYSAVMRVLLNISDDLLQRLEDFRYENRFPSRTAAIVWLLWWALQQNPKREPKQ